ncbi:SPFH domain-containing protein [Oceanibacterium hippocampi]|uniref:Protein QmcA n=1 Tax=Oceanibacterium hippocampi TaxID=745714 RepID=A0A1Y5TVT9_9PROT|nr:SPFH domain-containing protein [Oceanibacterium hippocampi]SLN74554.1 Modulator of FtsH protease HflK [Oceanibacterium hippocampi]
MEVVNGFGVFVIVVVVLALIIVFMGVTTVPQGHAYTVERFGRYTRTLFPGLNLIVPFVDRIGAKLNMMEQVLDVPQQEVISRDNAMVTVDGVVFYQVLDAAKAAYEVRDLTLAILNLTMTNLRTVLGSLDLDEALAQRDQINARLLTVIDLATNPWGIKVTRVEIKDIEPPADLVQAMGRQMKAEREKRATILQAEGARQGEILRAEGEKQAAILEAEGRLEAANRDAKARERLAEAEARATAMVSAAIAEGDVQAINYFVAQRYVEAMKEIGAAPNSKLVLMPMEATGLIGSLGGIGELTREIFGKGGGSSGPAPSRTPPSRPRTRATTTATAPTSTVTAPTSAAVHGIPGVSAVTASVPSVGGRQGA